jgi:hypothetical protein
LIVSFFAFLLFPPLPLLSFFIYSDNASYHAVVISRYGELEISFLGALKPDIAYQFAAKNGV